jgi:hypothetical protein
MQKARKIVAKKFDGGYFVFDGNPKAMKVLKILEKTLLKARLVKK